MAKRTNTMVVVVVGSSKEIVATVDPVSVLSKASAAMTTCKGTRRVYK